MIIWLLRRLGLRWHSQNLNDKPLDRTGSMFWHGRGWLGFGRNDETGHPTQHTIHVSWVIGRWRWGLEWGFGEEDGPGIHLSFSIPGLTLYLTLVPRWKSWLAKIVPSCDRRFNLYRHDGAWWCQLWGDKFGERERWWERMHRFSLVDLIVGRLEHREWIVLREVRVLVPMPEDVYLADVKIEEGVWKRKRWPFAKRHLSATVSFMETVGIVDDTRSLSCPCPSGTTAEAVSHMVRTLLKDRERHDGTLNNPDVDESVAAIRALARRSR